MNEKRVPWTVNDSIVALILFLIAVNGATIIAGTLLRPVLPRFALVIAFIVGYLFAFLIIWYIAVKLRGADWQTLGFRSFNFWGGLGLAIAAFFIARVITAIYTVIAQQLGLEPSQDLARELPRAFGTGTAGFILAIIVVAVIAPVVEELFFRGFLYTALRKRWGIVAAVILSSVIFSFFHFNVFNFIPIVIIGVALAYLYEITGSLGPPIMLHALNNLLSVIVVYYTRFLPVNG